MARKDKTDKEIEQAYYRFAQGCTISILDIPKLYRDARAAINSGSSVDSAVAAAVLSYCQKA